PNVVGQTVLDAEASLAQVTLSAAATTAWSSTVPVDVVISQSPAAGTLMASDSEMAIVVSLGPRPPASVDVKLSSSEFGDQSVILTTIGVNEHLVAFVGSDGPMTGGQTVTVS